MLFRSTSSLEWNVRTHNAIAKKYERMHGEIYNEREQSRLKEELLRAVSSVRSGSKTCRVLDFGCGAGNLTRHLEGLGCEVLASDVSQGFLDLVAAKSNSNRVQTVKLNGLDLSNIPDESVDMVATYSVLHHIPDYTGILKEFMRVLKYGGVVYIDHEQSEEYWSRKQIYCEFQLCMKKKTPINYLKYLVLTNYFDWFIRKFVNRKYHREGDIHVFDDDHIEWSKVVETLKERGGVPIYQNSYLLFRRHYDTAIYEEFVHKATDMHVLVARKQSLWLREDC